PTVGRISPVVAKLERLLNLTAALLDTARPLAASEIRARVPGYPESDGAAHRAFERDKDDLRELGIPVEVSEVPGSDPPVTGYRIPRDRYYLADPGLEPDELAALHLAATAVRLDGVEGAEALWKLGGADRADAPDAGPVAELPTDPHLVPLFAAAAEHRVAAFGYNGRAREVEPYRIDFQNGRWYLTARERPDGDAPKVFRLDRVEGTVATGAPGAFDRPGAVPAPVLGGWRLGAEPPVTARVRVDAEQAPTVVWHLGTEAVVEREPDGSVVVELEATHRDGFRSFVLTLLDHAEVLEPAELRADVVAWLDALAADR
ncbi:MAG TPA: WYL domain-containing protein, partial [Acidimicrobiales bacterium]|nr:WYL domain-containing protein [Acidimicrobiales bacterium]